jgi:hypothetical protein
LAAAWIISSSMIGFANGTFIVSPNSLNDLCRIPNY